MASDVIKKVLKLEDKASKPLKNVGKAADETTSKFEGLDAGLGVVKKGLAAAAVGATAMTVAMGALAVGAISTGSQMEGFQVRLETLLGSAAKAEDRLKKLFEIGATTPFELSQLVEADTALEAFGVNADKWRGPVMDLAGAMGIDLVEAATSIGRAFAGGAGAADTLRDRGVLNMIALKKGIKATEMSAKEFQAALFETLTDPNGRIAGGTAKLATTFSGMISNMQDAWFKFKKQVADAGLFLTAKATLQVILELIDKNKKGTEDWAGSTSGALTDGLFGIAEILAFIGKQGANFGKGVAGWQVLFLALEEQVQRLQVEMLKLGQGSLEMAVQFGQFVGSNTDVFDRILAGMPEQVLLAEGRLSDIQLEILETKNGITRMHNAWEKMDSVTGVIDTIKERVATLRAELSDPMKMTVATQWGDTPAWMMAGGGVLSAPATPTTPTPPKKTTGKSTAQKEFERLTKAVEGLVPKQTLTAAEKMRDLMAEIRENMGKFRESARRDWAAVLDTAEAGLLALTRAEIMQPLADLADNILPDVQDGIAQLTEALGKLADDAKKNAKDAAAAIAQAFVGAIQDPTSLLALAGPGGAVAGGLLAVGGGGKKAAEETLQGILDSVKGLATVLPTVLAKMIPDFIAELPAALIESTIKSLPEMVTAFVFRLPEAIAKSIVFAMAALWESFKQLILRLIPGRQKGEEDRRTETQKRMTQGKWWDPSTWGERAAGAADAMRGRQTGGFVNRTGLAMLHAGEYVQPTSGAASQSARGRMGPGGGGVNVTINTAILDPNVVDQLGRQLQRHFGSMGRATLPIFGGA